MSYDMQCSSCGGICGRGGCKRENVSSWEQRQRMATPHDQLIAELLDSRIPKTEREHAAAREIERLNDLIDEVYADKERYFRLYNSACIELQEIKKTIIPSRGESIDLLDAAIVKEKGEA